MRGSISPDVEARVAKRHAIAGKIKADGPGPGEPPEAPEAPPSEPDTYPQPLYSAGTRVKCMDPMRKPGVIAGDPMRDPYCYQVQPDDGSAPYTETESMLKTNEQPPAETPVPDPAQQPAPAAIATACGLKEGATVSACVTAIGDTQKALETVTADRDGTIGDKASALKAARVKADLADDAGEKLSRASGQTWAQAVAALKASKPSYFEPDAAPEKTEASAGNDKQPETPKARPEASGPRGKMPEGADVGANRGTGGVSGGKKGYAMVGGALTLTDKEG